MTRYTIKSEYLTSWGSDCDEETIITAEELQRLSNEWEIPMEELKDQLIELQPAKISIDNGMHWVDPEEAIAGMSWDIIAAYMDDETRERVAFEIAPCSDIDFLRRYLEIAHDDLIIG